MSIELIPLCIATARLAEPFILPDTPVGTRVIAEVTEFTFEGDRIRGAMEGHAAADWLTIDSRAMGTIDVRALIRTHDDALIFAAYRGRLDLSGGPGSSPAYSAPLFETGDERYLWVNGIQAIAKGTVGDGGHTLVYEMYEVR
jgi:hypothetical protein